MRSKTRDCDPIAEIPRPDNDDRGTHAADANARLISAAPELLGAARSALRALRDNLQPGPMDADAITALENAIARATHP